MVEFRDGGSGRRNPLLAELRWISSEEAYSCSLRQTIRVDTQRSSCHLQRSHPWGPTFHCCSAYNSQTHCNLQGSGNRNCEWCKTRTQRRHAHKFAAGPSRVPLVVRALPDVLSCLVSISCAKLFSPCKQTLREATTAWNRNTEGNYLLRMERLAKHVRAALRRSVQTSEGILRTSGLIVLTWVFCDCQAGLSFFLGVFSRETCWCR